MKGLENISLKLSARLGDRLNKTEEEKAVLNYGMLISIHTSIAILMTFLIGLITGMLIEIMIISFVSALLKRYSGGVHSSTPERCLITGLLLAFILSVLCKYLVVSTNLWELAIITGLVLIIDYYLIYKNCPVPSKNKPLKKESTRKRLRKNAFKLMNIYSISIIVLYSIYLFKEIDTMKILMISILLGVSLQVFAITKSGAKFVNLLEKLFNFFKLN